MQEGKGVDGEKFRRSPQRPLAMSYHSLAMEP